MKRPVIGVLPLIDDGRESYWMLPGYMEGIIAAGALPVMLTPTADLEMIGQMCALCDGFLFTGGHDVSPALYNEERIPQCDSSSALRDGMEAEVFRLAYREDKPILGICRGIQFINAVMGGTLWQDLPSQRPTGVEHHQTAPYDRPVHDVILQNGNAMYDLLKDLADDGVLHVNSYHHQAVKDTASGLTVTAVSEDGLVEGVCDNTRRFLWAVQWHPEFSFRTDETSRRIFAAFVESATEGGLT